MNFIAEIAVAAALYNALRNLLHYGGPKINPKKIDRLLVSTLVIAALSFCRPALSASRGETGLAKQIRNDQTLHHVRQMALTLLKGGFNAGSGYDQVWIRDATTFIEVALEVNQPSSVKRALLPFFQFQGEDGNIVDGYVPINRKRIRPDTRLSKLAPGLMAFKNSVEVDQESSLVQAVSKYVAITGDRAFLSQAVGGRTVLDRLGLALNYLLTRRYDPAHGLIWSATRADWGDVQPEDSPGADLNSLSHRSLSIYDNAMLILAIDDYIGLLGNSPQAAHWRRVGDQLKSNCRKYLWDAKDRKFFPHVYLDGSPFPAGFNENRIYYHGGTAVAILAGLLTHKETLHALARMDADVRNAHAATIGLTMYPAYPLGYFKNPHLTAPYTYQNGGDWTWFGGRMVRALIEQGDIADAYREIRPMVERVQRVNGFYEWWTLDNEPKGSANFRGSAGVLGRDIELLQTWAAKQ